MKFLELFLLLTLSTLVAGHGRMTKPNIRLSSDPRRYENDPVVGGNNVPAYVCRHAEKQHNTPDPEWIAGENVIVQWHFSAVHVGDCEGYLSYDYGKAREEMTWIKIANWPECDLDNDQDVPMRLPSWLPEGKAVFRFHWYALHNRAADNIEFYTQCADVSIKSQVKEWPTGLLSFSLINPPLFPSVGSGYRAAFNGEKWMTGPSCSAPTGLVNSFNHCELTARGATKGWLDVTGGNDPNIVPPDDNNNDSGNDDNNNDSGNDDNHDDSSNDDNNDDNHDDDHHDDDPTRKTCPSGTFVSVDIRATDTYCQGTCTWNMDYCDPDFCTCQGGYKTFEPVESEITASSEGVTPTWRVIYINWRVSDWSNLYNDIVKAVDLGFNVVILAFHMGVDPVTNAENIMDAAQVWRDMTAEQKQQTKNYLATKNARLLISLGGETLNFESEITRGSAQSLCTKAGQWAIDHNLDGVDVDMELEPGNSAPFHDGSAIDWLVTCTKALRSKLGDERLISHAPLAPYFGTWAGSKRGYVEVFKQAPTINILNIQYYNQGDWVYTTYHELFVANTIFPGTAVKELLDAGIPEDRLVVGKPVYDGDASNGHVSASDLRSWGSQACLDFNWSAGFMGWQFRPEISDSSFAHEVTSTICHNVARAPLLGSSLIEPLHQPNDEPKKEESDSVEAWVVVLAVVGSLLVVGLIAYFYWSRSATCSAYKTNLVEEGNYENMNKV